MRPQHGSGQMQLMQWSTDPVSMGEAGGPSCAPAPLSAMRSAQHLPPAGHLHPSNSQPHVYSLTFLLHVQTDRCPIHMDVHTHTHTHLAQNTKVG